MTYGKEEKAMKRIMWLGSLLILSTVLMAGDCGDPCGDGLTCCGIGCDEDTAIFDATGDAWVAVDTSDSWAGNAPVEATMTPQAGDMEPTTGSITGLTCSTDSMDSPPEATVRVYISDGDGGIIAETLTDADGYFELSGVPPGTWPVIVENGPFSGTHTVVVEAGMTTEVTQRLCMA
jgi:hypothetical protein